MEKLIQTDKSGIISGCRRLQAKGEKSRHFVDWSTTKEEESAADESQWPINKQGHLTAETAAPAAAHASQNALKMLLLLSFLMERLV